MITINGKYNFAHIMCDKLDSTTHNQIRDFLNCPAFKGTQIRIMADTHAGIGSVIGYTSTMNDQIIPNVVGVDLGCGIEAYCLGKITIDFEALDKHIRQNVPSGFKANRDICSELSDRETAPFLFGNTVYANTSHFMAEIKELSDLIFNKDGERLKKVYRSLGSLGGGNHFLEIDVDENGVSWLLVHSGSRNFGLQVCNYFQNKAKELMKKFFLEDQFKDTAFLPLDLGGDEYLLGMRTSQKYAVLNRHLIAKTIVNDFFGLDIMTIKSIKTVHNYISFEDNIIRKGAISAHENERVLIPINMRDGTIVGIGKGSKKWNHSAPHGAGRVLGRKEANRTLSMDEYKNTMKDVWTSCVSEKTLDEAPMAYKSLDFILKAIEETVDVEFVMKPIYNFKAQD